MPTPPSGRSEYYSIFVIECKGDAPNSAICLFDKSHDFIRAAPLMHQGTIYRPLSKLKYRIGEGFSYYNPNPVYEKQLWICEEKLPISFRYCHTGYFFKAPNYKKSNDDKDNLFKAIKNIAKSMPTLAQEIQKIINSSETGKKLLEISIFPLILTNVKIFVNISDQKNMAVDWAVYNPGTNLEPAINPAGINDFFVTNLDALPEFIKRFA